MEILIILIVLTPFLGVALASFFTAKIMRSEKLTKVKGERSECDNCGKRLSAWELIPLVSYIIQRGKCRGCKKAIPVRIFLAEFLALIMFTVLAVGFFNMTIAGSSILVTILCFLIYFGLFVGFLYLAIFDLLTMTIPAKATYWLTFYAVIVNILILLLRGADYQTFAHIPLGRLDNILAGVVGAAFIYLLIRITKQRGMGQGDLYIALLMGLMLGGERSVAAFYVTVFTATFVGVYQAVAKKKLHGLIVPLVPFMAIGTVVAFVWGTSLFAALFFGLV